MFRLVDQGQRKARKPHNCWACNKSIDKGTRYNYEVYSCDEIYELKLHTDCVALMYVYGCHFQDYDNGGCYPIHEWAELQPDGVLDFVGWQDSQDVPDKLEDEWRVIMGLPIMKFAQELEMR